MINEVSLQRHGAIFINKSSNFDTASFWSDQIAYHQPQHA